MLKKKLAHRTLTIGSWITAKCEENAEIMAQAGYDWLVIDMEHSAISISDAQNLIRAIDCWRVPALVRVGANDPVLIKRAMDAGASGVVVPMVNTEEQARKAAESAYYPPSGIRGVGLARAQKYGGDFENYRKWSLENTCVIVQIEHIEAVENLDKILSVEGIDGFIVGPYDLSGSLGVPGQFEHPSLRNALQKIESVSKKLDALAGFHVISPEKRPLKEKVEQGYKFIAHSLDTLILGEGARKAVAYHEEIAKKHREDH